MNRILTTTPPDILTAGSHFARVPRADINRSVFDRSHSHKTTFDAGKLIPVFRDIVFPGDTINLSTTVLARLATPIKPFMDQVIFDFHLWAVPIRLLWEHWQNFMGERRPEPNSSIVYTTPKLDMDGCTVSAGDIFDYLGFRQRAYTSADDDRYHALYLRAYNFIYNEQYRDENLGASMAMNLNDGDDAYTDYAICQRGKRHDYFTSALPLPQKGNAVSIPLGTSAPVMLSATTGISPIIRKASDHTIEAADALTGLTGTTGIYSTANPGATNQVIDPNGTMYADLSTATAATINALRIGIATQQLLERDYRGGTRYTELIQAHFCVVSPDARMQRPELVGTCSFDLNAVPIPMSNASSGSTSATKQGNLAAFAHGFGSGSAVQSFTEHCILMGILSARAPYTYQQGIRRDQRYSTRYDFYLPDFANLGEQSILNDEIYSQGTSDDNETFGYQERWAEMRYMPGQVSGVMNSDCATSIDIWHLAQDFGSLPALDESFIVEDPPIDRVIAVSSEPHFIADIWFNYRHTRPLPVFSIPGLTRI